MTRTPDMAIRVAELRKNFGGVAALAGVELEVRRGSIHALVGENGAGKSTALGAIAGRLAPDSGRIEIFGEVAEHFEPKSALALGVAAIYQELTVIPALDATTNVFLGQALARVGVRRQGEMRRRFNELCQRLNVSIAASARAGELSVADQQMLEIMRALVFDARVLLLDEPTASLVQAERESLFRLMRELRDAGTTMLLVSHNLDEVLAIADDVTVFRNGATVATGPARDWTKATLVSAMLGAAAPDLALSHRATSKPDGMPTYAITNLSVPGVLSNIDLEIRAGEILGVAGLVGSGRTTLLRALAGLEPRASGNLAVDAISHPWPTSVRRALSLDIALVPEDRKGQGLLLQMSARENIGIANMDQFSRCGVILRKRMAARATEALSRYSLSSSRIEQPVRNLSGGNQQKVLLTRWEMRRPRLLLADEPTRGVDVGAKASILESLREFATNGASVVVVSSELEELTSLADRVVVISQGQLVRELDAGRQGVGVDQMLAAAFSTTP